MSVSEERSADNAVSDRQMANAIRALSMDAVQQANSGHPGMPMGMADAATVLFRQFLKFDPQAPDWADRDRFILSAGHGSMLLYALLYLTGYDAPTIEDIRKFRQIDSPCAGHPENFKLAGVEATTGPLGQGFAMAVGMAIAERHLNADYGDRLVDHRTWVIAGDGCLMEGINHEAAGLAGHLKLDRLNVLWDDNRITIDGNTDLSTSEDVLARYAATGWHTVTCDGHDPQAVAAALTEARDADRPSLIACRTIIGYGSPNKQGTAATHGAPLGTDEIEAARAELDWPYDPFEIPNDILAEWRAIGESGAKRRREWEDRLSNSDRADEFRSRMAGKLPRDAAIDEYLEKLASDPPKVASRKASEMALAKLTARVPAMIGGSADLTGSNNTKTDATAPLTAQNYGGRYLYYGIREFGMAAAMNGMALHGGIIPYGGTFLVFSDYCRSAMRLSAIQNVRVVYVMTHDSIGLGEDGPTHQPIEHLQSLRMMPNMTVFRPADAIETAECWALALAQETGPSTLALSRQGLPPIRHDAKVNRCIKGAYSIDRDGAGEDPQVVILATGSEVSLALDVAAQLDRSSIPSRVVSMPCTSLFDAQDDTYRESVLGTDVLRVSIEAGTSFGWERYTGRDGLNFGIDHFGASGPIADLYAHYGLTADRIASKIARKFSS